MKIHKIRHDPTDKVMAHHRQIRERHPEMHPKGPLKFYCELDPEQPPQEKTAIEFRCEKCCIAGKAHAIHARDNGAEHFETLREAALAHYREMGT